MTDLLASFAAAFGWGLLASSGILVGVAFGLLTRLAHRTIAAVMSLGAGVLLAAASVELATQALEAAGALLTAGSIGVGAAAFSLANASLTQAKDRKRCGECVQQPREAEAPGSGASIALGTALDAVPEALVLGVMLRQSGPDLALIAALALSNTPEALSGVAGMRQAGRSYAYIVGLWESIAVGTAAATGLAFAFLGGLGPSASAALQALGAGALLAMAAETLIPEAFHNGPRYSGVLAAGGFSGLLLIAALVR
jgi:zinc transporter, ZIP family